MVEVEVPVVIEFRDIMLLEGNLLDTPPAPPATVLLCENGNPEVL